MRAPVVSARGSVGTRELVIVRLENSDGAAGLGEAAPLQSYDGVSIEEVVEALEDCRAAVGSSDGVDLGAVLAECRRLAVLPQAVAAIDLALWDLAGRRVGQPVWRLLGVDSPPPVEVNATIVAADRAGAATEAAAARAQGFRCVKMKVGIGDDAGRVAAVRAAAGSEMALRLDANGAWSVDEALATLRQLTPARIELCEEPVSGIEGCEAAAASSTVPIALDESTVLPGALDHRVCAAVCLKLTRCGGISGVIDAARRARTAGYEVYLASTYDGPLGIAAALHAAAAVVPDRPCGLATLSMFEGGASFEPRDGRLTAPTAPGLGANLSFYRYVRGFDGFTRPQ